MSARVVAACRAVTKKPLITKLSPNQTDIADNARRCVEAGTDAFAVINTIMGMAIDIEARRPILFGNRQGGLSGPAIKPIALLKVHQVYEVCRPHGIPIIGQGGIASAEDAIEFLLAGATAIGIGTALFYDPLICPKVNARDRRVPGAPPDAVGLGSDRLARSAVAGVGVVQRVKGSAQRGGVRCVQGGYY